MSAPLAPGNGHPIRRDQLRTERNHDPYRMQQKPSEPAVCPDCGAVFRQGRWQWGTRPQDAKEFVCAACHRIREHYPAGYVHLGGPYFEAHRDELDSLIRHHEERAKSKRPLERIMDIEPNENGVTITTTDVHLARDLGSAVYRAHHGEVKFHYSDGENLVRVHWHR